MDSGKIRHKWMLCVLCTVSTIAAATAASAATGEQEPATAAAETAQPSSTTTSDGKNATPSEQNAASSASTSTTPKPAQATAQKVVLVDNTIDDHQLKLILAKGYRPESHNGLTVYCRKETPVGTRFPTKTCRTSANILETEEKSKDAAATFERTDGNRALDH